MSEKISASHILVMHKDSSNSRSKLSKDAALKLCNDIYAQILERPNLFKDLAIKHSDCASSSAGGFLGEFKKGVMVKEFEEVAFSLKVNEFSKPTETDFGFHIIKRDD